MTLVDENQAPLMVSGDLQPNENWSRTDVKDIELILQKYFNTIDIRTRPPHSMSSTCTVTKWKRENASLLSVSSVEERQTAISESKQRKPQMPRVLYNTVYHALAAWHSPYKLLWSKQTRESLGIEKPYGWRRNTSVSRSPFKKALTTSNWSNSRSSKAT